MAVTRSSAADRRRSRVSPVPRRGVRGYELPWLLAVSAVTVAGLWLAYQAKTHPLAAPPAQPVLDLRTVERPAQLLPFVGNQAAARRIYEFLSERGGSIPNVGALMRTSVLTPAEFARLKPSFVVRGDRKSVV